MIRIKVNSKRLINEMARQYLNSNDLADLGTVFFNKETGKNENNEIIKDLLKDEKIKDRFYTVLNDELEKVLNKKYGI